MEEIYSTLDFVERKIERLIGDEWLTLTVTYENTCGGICSLDAIELKGIDITSFCKKMQIFDDIEGDLINKRL